MLGIGRTCLNTKKGGRGAVYPGLDLVYYTQWMSSRFIHPLTLNGTLNFSYPTSDQASHRILSKQWAVRWEQHLPACPDSSMLGGVVSANSGQITGFTGNAWRPPLQDPAAVPSHIHRSIVDHVEGVYSLFLANWSAAMTD